MERRGILVLGSAFIVAGALVIFGVLGLVGLGYVDAGGLVGESSEPPALLEYTSAGAQCTDSFRTNSSSSVAVGAGNTEITYSSNVSLPDPSYAIGSLTFTQLNESTYVLNVPVEETEKAPRNCSGVARYNATMRIPNGEDKWHLLIKHDGEVATKLYGESNSSLTGGSASVGQSVSGPEPEGNATTEST